MNFLQNSIHAHTSHFAKLSYFLPINQGFLQSCECNYTKNTSKFTLYLVKFRNVPLFFIELS
ncbi:hypothetical protein [Campylobacter troglodytis]|uniref:hypothetical protein n=1 Tax=Campylobacter troglodytis TaxID=654363 RepID=UPI00115A75DB|nr:hypothetical protein [Campylobacter troglodytis]TQR61300.1 hypothetical protein DMC01_01600 [Campylobacter troglodytis]